MESMRKGVFLILNFYRNCTQLNLQGVVDVLYKVSGASLDDTSNRSYRKTASCMVVESTNFPPEHTILHPARCIDISERIKWIRFC
jgi:hypothetical protein